MSSTNDNAPRSKRSIRAIDVARTVLVVDDDDATRTLVTRWLKKAQLDVVEAASGEAALDAVERSAAIDAIVLDVMMPGLDGYSTLAKLKETPKGAAIPVLLLTAHANEDGDVVRGVEHGAVDHIAKPFSGPVLAAKVRAACDRGRAERELRAKLANAEQNAAIDPLTRLGNRRFFESRLREEAAFARRHSQPFALVLLDLDHFKSINDTFGHEEGDRVLVHVADAIRAILRADDAAFRYGGEEFVLMLRACDADHAVRAAERLRAALQARPIALGEPPESRTITFSAGVASPSADNGFATEDLVARADAALYRAKRGGRDRVEIAAPTES
jgi:diguanylate cyclase (GGDEF)-like protein